MKQFTELLNEFNKLVEGNPTIKLVADKLGSIKIEAVSSNLINSRQKEAIIARVNNYISGIYGKSKTISQLNQTKLGK